jgi:hypothetical protein
MPKHTKGKSIRKRHTSRLRHRRNKSLRLKSDKSRARTLRMRLRRKKNTRRKLLRGGAAAAVAENASAVKAPAAAATSPAAAMRTTGFNLPPVTTAGYTDPVQTLLASRTQQAVVGQMLSGGGDGGLPVMAPAPIVTVPQFPGTANAGANSSLVNIAKLYDLTKANSVHDADVAKWKDIPAMKILPAK